MKTQLNKLANIVQESVYFHENMTEKINDLCNDPEFGFRNQSRLSHIIDRLDLYIRELKEFTPKY